MCTLYLPWPVIWFKFRIKVRQSRNNFFKPTFPPKNEQTNSTLLLWYLRLTCFHLFFGRNWRHQKEILKLTDLYKIWRKWKISFHMNLSSRTLILNGPNDYGFCCCFHAPQQSCITLQQRLSVPCLFRAFMVFL